jgi:hypothetical protein
MGRRGPPRGEQVMATLLTNTPLRALEVSQTGCLVESVYRIEAGTAGRLRLLIDGRTYSGEARVTRCQRVHGGTTYRLGVEFLRTRRPSVSSLFRMVDEMLDSRAQGAGRENVLVHR